MRSAPLRSGLTVVFALALAGRATADPAPYAATVTAAEAEVRSGPSTDTKFYATNRLRRGDIVQVLRERTDGWLEIRPPEGSFSWIDTRSIRQVVANLPDNYLVEAAAGTTVPVLVGSELLEGQPTVVGDRLPRSAQVRRYRKGSEQGRDHVSADGTLTPIEPPPGEVRYLRSEAIGKPAATGTTAALPVGAAAAAAGAAGSSFTPTPVPPGPSNDRPSHAEVEEIYNKAVEADRAGRVSEAVQLYTKAASMGMQINSPVAPQAIRRANYLLAGQANASPPAPDSRFSPMPSGSAMSPSVQLARPCAPASSGGATFTTSRQGTAAAAASTQWVGRLRRAGRGIFDRPTYVLESSWGSPILYANAGPGVDLESHVGQTIELVGSAYYHGEMRANYILVTAVKPAP